MKSDRTGCTGRPRVHLLLAIAAVAWSRLGAADTLPVIQCQPGQPDCIPTAQECAGGGRDGIYYYGSPDRPVGICVGAAGHDIFYLGGNPAKAGCGGIMVADQAVIGDPSQDANACAVLDQNGEIPVSGPSFANYKAPAAAGFAGETSIGVDRGTNAAMFLNRLITYRVTFDDTQNPPTATWKDVSYLVTDTVTGDPFLWTDSSTGRTIVAQCLPTLNGRPEPTGGTSLIAYTDDDGQTWQASEPPITGMPWACAERVDGGPYRSPTPPRASSYPNAVYYCDDAFDLSTLRGNVSQCARSDDGGQTWGPPVDVNGFRCGAQFGRPAVSSLGTVVVAFSGCFGGPGGPGVVVSKDNGLTWQLNHLPSSGVSVNRPTLAFDAGGRLYFFAVLDGRPIASTSGDEGTTWSVLTDVGLPFGIQNAAFPMAVAGDPGRAAAAFYGTTTPGDSSSKSFDGVWHLYVTATIDGGSTWQTVDATPGDPVQRGCIGLGSDANSCRNQLDFQNMTVDRDGRILVGYADGCVTAKCLGPAAIPSDSRDSVGTIARQVSGERLITGSPGSEPPPPPPALPPPPPPPGCTPGVGDCFPTPQQCATGNYDGYWPGGPTGRGAVCVGDAGHNVFYAGGNVNTPCGVIIVADAAVSGDPGDPNACP